MSEEMITIPKWKFDRIEDAIRLTINIFGYRSKNYKDETAYDRTLIYEISTTINSNHPWIILEVLIDKNQWVRRRIMIFSISYWE